MNGAETSPRDEMLTAIEQEVGQLFRRVRLFVADQSKRLDPNLFPTSYLILSYLDKRGPVRPSAIADHFLLDKGAVSRQLTHLEELGFLVKQPDPEDGRAQLVTVSQKARAGLAESRKERSRFLLDHLSEWPDESLGKFVEILKLYNSSLA